jgi:hypothetical protein
MYARQRIHLERGLPMEYYFNNCWIIKGTKSLIEFEEKVKILIENTFKGKLDDKNTSNILVKYSVNHPI